MNHILPAPIWRRTQEAERLQIHFAGLPPSRRLERPGRRARTTGHSEKAYECRWP
jgi:hypothetical protein